MLTYPQGVYTPTALGYPERYERRPLQNRRWGFERPAHGLRGLVGARARLRDLRDHPGLGPAGAGRAEPRRGRPWSGGQGDRSGRRLLVVLLRRNSHRQVALPEGRLGRIRARLPVRLDEPSDRAGGGALAPDRLAVHSRRVRRRARAGSADDDALARVR